MSACAAVLVSAASGAFTPQRGPARPRSTLRAPTTTAIAAAVSPSRAAAAGTPLGTGAAPGRRRDTAVAFTPPQLASRRRRRRPPHPTRPRALSGDADASPSSSSSSSSPSAAGAGEHSQYPSGTTTASLAALVERALTRAAAAAEAEDTASPAPFPFLFEGAEGLALGDGVVFQGDFSAVAGRESYSRASMAWARVHAAEMPQRRCAVLRVSQTSPTQVLVQWRLRWLSPAIQRLAAAFLALPLPPNKRVVHFDVLDRVTEKSEFKWGALFKTLGKALVTGELRLPESAVVGTAELEFAAEKDERGRAVLVRHVERVGVVPVFKRGVARNRRVTADLVLFLEGRRSSGVGGAEWDDRLREELQLSQVPGVSQFSVDGMEDPARQKLYDDLSVLLFIATAAVLAFGVAVGARYFGQLERERAIAELVRAGADVAGQGGLM